MDVQKIKRYMNGIVRVSVYGETLYIYTAHGSLMALEEERVERDVLVGEGLVGPGWSRFG